jgi:hypothetical protein
MKFGRSWMKSSPAESLQFGVLHLGLLQDGNVGIGIFPGRENFLARMAESLSA